MLLGLVALIVLILLFGAVAVRSALARVMLFVIVLVGSIVVWAAVYQMELRDWLTMAAAVVLIAATAVVVYSVWARQDAALSAKRSLENTWDFYEKRGLFTEQEVREHAAILRDHGDSRELENYCRSQLSNRVVRDDAVQRVWSWFAEDIERRFDAEARAQAHAYFEANDALRLDRFCRSELQAKDARKSPTKDSRLDSETS